MWSGLGGGEGEGGLILLQLRTGFAIFTIVFTVRLFIIASVVDTMIISVEHFDRNVTLRANGARRCSDERKKFLRA